MSDITRHYYENLNFSGLYLINNELKMKDFYDQELVLFNEIYNIRERMYRQKEFSLDWMYI